MHIGVITQIYFGIKGKRYETEYNYHKTKCNDYWVRPLQEETPKNYNIIEDECYR